MGDHQDTASVSAIDLFDQLQDFHRCGGIQSAGGFVAEQDAGVLYDGPANGRSLLLAAGKLAGKFILMVFQAQDRDQLIKVQGRITKVSPDFNIFPYGQVGDQVVGLKNVAQVPAAVGGQLFFIHFADRLAVDGNGTGIGAVNAADDVEKGGFSASGRAQQDTDGAFFQGKTDSLQDKCPGIAASVGFFDILQFQIHTGSFLIKSVSMDKRFKLMR